MKFNPLLSFRGECEAAFTCYARCFAGTIVTMLTYADSPQAESAPPEWRGKIFHATLAVGDQVLMGGDVLPEQYEPAKGFRIMIALDDPVEAERVFQALAERGTVQMPMQQTFWAVRFGVLVDRFGIPWVI